MTNYSNAAPIACISRTRRHRRTSSQKVLNSFGSRFIIQVLRCVSTTTTTTTVLPSEPVPEETFTHSYLSSSSTILYRLPLSTTIHSVLSIQFTCLTVFCTTYFQVLFGRPLGLEPSTSYSTHFFTQSLSSFHNTCPYHHNLFCCSTEITSSTRSISRISLLKILSFTLT